MSLLLLDLLNKMIIKMKRTLSMLVIMFLAVGVAEAQKIPTRYDFYYIAHDNETPVSRLVDELKEAASFAERLSTPAIFYLANGDKPIVVKFNTEDENEMDFENILLKELREKDFHNPAGRKDLLNILDIIKETDFVINGKMIQDTFFQFYVGKEFWERECHISVIAALYCILNVEHYTNDGMVFEIYSHHCDEIKSYCKGVDNPEGYKLFGEQNYNGLNEMLTIYEY